MSTPENKPLTPSTVLMSVVMLFSSVSGGVVVNSLGGGAAIDSKGVPSPALAMYTTTAIQMSTADLKEQIEAQTRLLRRICRETLTDVDCEEL